MNVRIHSSENSDLEWRLGCRTLLGVTGLLTLHFSAASARVSSATTRSCLDRLVPAGSPTPPTPQVGGRWTLSRTSCATRCYLATPTPTASPQALACRRPGCARTPAG